MQLVELKMTLTIPKAYLIFFNLSYCKKALKNPTLRLEVRKLISNY